MSYDYLIQMALQTDSTYVKLAKDLVIFVKDIFRNLEPSHFDGILVVFFERGDSHNFKPDTSEKFYDKGMLNDSFNSIVFQLFQDDKLPYIWTNVDKVSVDVLLSADDDFIAYVYEDEQEYFIVNQQKFGIVNSYSCPSIFALQYHELNEALLTYKSERIKASSCEHFKVCWADTNRIYFKNKPEDCMQLSLSEFLKNRLRGVDIVREYNLGASKPVDVRVYWYEANRAALIEVKWLGRSVKDNGELSTSYSNSRANGGMQQIKEYLDLENSDTPMVITKGYLVVVDGRRNGIHASKVSQISLRNGMAYQNTELNIADDKKYWETYKNIEKPIRMFAEPICEK